MDTASLEAQYAKVDLIRGQVLCRDHGVQWAYDGETGKADPRGQCGQCIVEVRSGEFVACKDHGIQPAASRGGPCRVCDLAGVSLEAGAPELPAAGSVPPLGLSVGRVGQERGEAPDAAAGVAAPGDRGAGGRGASAAGEVLPPPLSGDGDSRAVGDPAQGASARKAAPAGTSSRRPLYRPNDPTE